MAALKDQIASDLAIFLNLDEFADTHDIDGIDMPAIVDEDVLKERPRSSARDANELDGIYLGNLVLFVRFSDLGYRPVVGQHIKVDSKLYLVADCSEAGGVLEITLEVNEA
jgi:hypothetical protein